MTTEDDTKKIRRTYGRGFLDGLASAGVADIAGHMNNIKLIEAERHQTGIARKVMYVIPTDVAVTRTKMMQELAAKGIGLNFRVLDGCLAKLLDVGLIKHIGKEEYIRVGLKPAAPKPEPPTAGSEEPAPTRVLVPANPVLTTDAAKTLLDGLPTPSPMDRLAELAAALRRLAAEAEDVALAIETKKPPPIDTEQVVREVLAAMQARQ